MKNVLRFGVGACVVLLVATGVRADPVTDWNAITLDRLGAAVAAGVRPGPSGVLDLAMVHAAIHDAVQAFENRFKPYTMAIPHAIGSPVAAIATAAHDVLVNRYPGQAALINALYADYLATHGLTGNPGVIVGQIAAAQILNARHNDGSFPVLSPGELFFGRTEPGQWRTLVPGLPMAAQWLGTVAPFTLKESNQFHADPPPALTSLEYSRLFNEVKALGSASSTARTAEQTDLGFFYSDNFFALLSRGLRAIAAAHITNLGDSARLLALANLAMADAVINCWADKKSYNFWRPITAVREAANDGNPTTTADPTWTPLIATPPYPDHTSGANNVTAATMRTLQLFFKTDKMTFDLTSTIPQAVQKTRTYHRFSDVMRDVVNVRIYQGIHFRTADVAGRRQGRLVAKWTFKHVLRPLHDDHGDDGDEKDDDNGGRR